MYPDFQTSRLSAKYIIYTDIIRLFSFLNIYYFDIYPLTSSIYICYE